MGRRELYLPEEYKGSKMAEKRRRRSIFSVAAAVILGVLLTGSAVRGQQVQLKERQTQEALAEEVLRFHVLANSNSEEDQELKMKVKEAILTYMEREIPQADSVDETKTWAESHLSEIETVAKQVVHREGYGYEVDAEVTESEFPDKTYGDVTFPAGEYEALRIEIGEAEGQNWWCVLYPNLCFLDAVNAVVPEEGKEELKEVLTEDEYEMVTMGSSFRIRWFFLGD